jgi:hypothetical protein
VAEALRAAASSSAVKGFPGGEGGGGYVAVGGDAEADGLGSAAGGQVGLGELVVGGGEADRESLGFAGPAAALGFGDAVQEVVADFFEPAVLGGVDPQEGHLMHDSLNYLILANYLKTGENLRSPDGGSAVVVGGSTPADHDGWMWDLTVPG